MLCSCNTAFAQQLWDLLEWLNDSLNILCYFFLIILPRRKFLYQAAGIRHRDNIVNYGWLDVVFGQVPGNRW